MNNKKITPFKLKDTRLVEALKNAGTAENKILLTDFCLWMKTEYDQNIHESAEKLVDRYLKSLTK